MDKTYWTDAAAVVADPEFQELIPPLSASEQELLVAVLHQEGCRKPLIVWPCGGRKILAPSAEVDAFTSDDEPFAIGDRDHFGVVPLLKQVLLSLRQLAQERAADVTDADNGERKRLASLEKYLMDHVERARLLRSVDDAGNVAL